MRHRVARLALCALWIAACSSDESAPACPTDGAQALKLGGAPIFLDGPNAVGGAGDYLLRNDRAAFVISGAGPQKTYYHYNGVVVDAVATKDCRQLAEEQFEELGILFGKLNLSDFYSSTLRAFRGKTFEIVSDGRNGAAAHLRVTGVDDYYWLVEYYIIKERFTKGEAGSLSEPFGVKAVVDYVLQPGSRTLEITFKLVNQKPETQRFLVGSELLFGDAMEERRYAKSALDFGGFSMRSLIPWLTAASGAGAYAFAIPDANMAGMNISGINVAMDLNEALAKPLQLLPGGEDEVKLLLAVGPTDGHSASRELVKTLPEPIPDWTYGLAPFSGSVHDKSGAPVTDAAVLLQLQDENGAWLTLDHYVTDARGHFGDDAAVFTTAGKLRYRGVVEAPGRNLPTPVEWSGLPAAPVAFTVSQRGRVAYDFRDSAGDVLPAKLTLFKDGELVQTFYTAGQGEAVVMPGSYEYSVTRGFEYLPKDGTFEVLAGAVVRLAAEIPHIVDTHGFLTADTHVHQAPSPDSRVPINERIHTAAAEDLDVPVATDHEIIVGLDAGVKATGLGRWVAPITGQEITATLPEHITGFPFVPDGSLRGGNVPWYQLGLSEMFAAAYGRGALVTVLNHPKSDTGCDYLCLIEWNRLTGEPTLAAGGPLGKPVTSPTWTWKFNGIELLNGIRSIWYNPARARESGLFDDWQSFINDGRRIAAVGTSDTHESAWLGMPRNFFAAKSDIPGDFDTQELVDAFDSGKIVISTGAFARVTVDGKGLGELATNTSGTATVHVHIEAIPAVDVQRFRVYVNCDEVAKVTAQAPYGLIKYDGAVTVPITKDANIVVSGFGLDRLPRALPQFEARNIPRFLTNPVYVDRDGNGKFDPPGGKSCTYTTD